MHVVAEIFLEPTTFDRVTSANIKFFYNTKYKPLPKSFRAKMSVYGYMFNAMLIEI